MAKITTKIREFCWQFYLKYKNWQGYEYVYLHVPKKHVFIKKENSPKSAGCSLVKFCGEPANPIEQSWWRPPNHIEWIEREKGKRAALYNRGTTPMWRKGVNDY